MVNQIRQKLKAFALADAILSEEWQYRYFSYNSNWSETEEMASLRDGSGGEWFLWISGQLAGYKCVSPEDGFMSDLESVKATLPPEYYPFVTEPAFSMDRATCIWYLKESSWIKHGLSVKWLIDLEAVMGWTAKDYHAWAVDYYEIDIDLLDIQSLIENRFSEKLAIKMNPAVSLIDLQDDVKEIGYGS